MILITLLVILGCTGISFSSKNTIDQVITQAHDEAWGFGQREDSTSIKVELDMRFTPEQWRQIQQQRSDDGQRRRKRKADRSIVKRWDDGIVPYTIEKGFSQQSKREVIYAAMNEWESFTCIRFRPADATEPSVKIIPTGECSSNIGKIERSGQTLELGWGCKLKEIALHELGHVLGFFHEQSRPDRDNYVKIHYENITPEKKYNFQKYSTKTINTHGIPYDYESIMHYGPYYFSRNEQKTMTAFRESDTKKIGNSYGLSYYDIHLANVMYNCNKSCSDKKYCHRGFLGKDCRCWCKGSSVEKPVVYCDNREAITIKPTPKPTTRPMPSDVTDSVAYCKRLAAAGFCTHDPYTRKNCKKSCYYYSQWVSPYGDVNYYCAFWASVGKCEENPFHMLEVCKRSCAQLTSCADELPEMCQMHRRQCNSSDLQHIMTKFCARTCNSCAKKQRIASCEDLAPRACSVFAIVGKCISEDPQIRKKMQITCPKACGKCDNPGMKYWNCYDRISNCQKWYLFLNGCDNDPFFTTVMKIFCRRTCKLC